jgi:peptidoglycan/LPS O-acetylase OafA/YrhL
VSGTSRKWLPEIDVLRAVAISLVVVFHMNYFTDFWAVRGLASYTSAFGLGLFFFISGFSIHYNSPRLVNAISVFCFLRKRLLRIYPLFIFASIVDLLINPNPLIRAYSFGYCIYLLNMPPLLLPRFDFYTGYWFIGAILFCYAIYIILNRLSRSSRDFIMLSLLVMIVLLSYRYLFDMIMTRVLVFACVFLTGVLAKEMKILEKKEPISFLIAIAAIFAISLFIYINRFYGAFPDDNIITLGGKNLIENFEQPIYQNIYIL